MRFIPEIIEKEGQLLGCELVENRGYADIHYELIGKCKFTDGTIHRVSVVVADKGDDLLHLTIYGKDIQKSFRHDTSDGIFGASSSIVKNLEANSTSFSVFGIDILSKSITSSKVDKSTKGFSSQKLMLTKYNLPQQNNLSSRNVTKSLTYSGHKLQGRTKLYGMDISIENKKGSYRCGIDPDGHIFLQKRPSAGVHITIGCTAAGLTRCRLRTDMHPKKVTVKKVTGVKLVTLFILILAVTQHIH